MLSTIQLEEYFNFLGTPLNGRRLVEKSRKESPVRKVVSTSGNVITEFSSKKMGRHIGTESRTVELPAVVQAEYDDKVIEYYPQPCAIDLILTDGGLKRPSRHQQYPDLLKLCNDQIVIEEWRTEGRLRKLAERYPGRYVFESGGWHFPEAEAQLAEMGITYRLRSSDEHPRQFVQNLGFLADFLSASCPRLTDKEIELIRAPLISKASFALADLIDILCTEKTNARNDIDEDQDTYVGKITTDHIYKAIVDKQLTVDLFSDDISETYRAVVYRDETAMAFYKKVAASQQNVTVVRLDASIQLGAEVEYEGSFYKIALVGEKSVMLTNDSAVTELPIDVIVKQYAAGKLKIGYTGSDSSDRNNIDSLSPKDLDAALKRSEELEQYKLSPEAAILSLRTLQRYKRIMRDAGDNLYDQHVALVPKIKNCGNRNRKIPKELLDLIGKLADEKYNTPTNINLKTAYKQFLDACSTNGIRTCSDKTFYKEVRALTSVRARQGKRVDYQKSEPIVWYLKLDEPIHGSRPFEIVHIDHTQLDVLLQFPNLKKHFKKAWLSLAIDGESRRIVGFYLTFEPPSYRSCMMVLRDLVRRHGRMPDTIVVDNGKEFKSHAFKRLCKFCGTSLRYRPAAKPRFGSVMERVFGTTDAQLIHNLSGNTQLMKYVRTVTKSVRPENFVEWTLPALHGALDYYFENLYGTENHPAHNEGPVEHFNARMVETGMRRHRLVRYDRTFLIETCPSVEDDTRVVNGQRGVKVGHIWYWCEAFRSISLHKKPVDVRFDPWDPRVVYVLINDQWHQCVSKLKFRLRHYTEIELRYAFAELAKEHGIEKKDLSPERVAEWMHVLEARNFDPRLREEQSEALGIYGHLNMAAVEPVSNQSPMDAPFSNSGHGDEGANPNKPITIDEEYEYELF